VTGANGTRRNGSRGEVRVRRRWRAVVVALGDSLRAGRDAAGRLGQVGAAGRDRGADAVQHRRGGAGAAIIRASEAVAEVWPGFWAPDVAFVIRPYAGGALLVTPRGTPWHGTRLLEGAAEDPLVAHAAVVPDTSAILPLDMRFDVGGRPTPAFSMLELGKEPHYGMAAQPAVGRAAWDRR
jgi:hypothetical protein